FTVACVALPAWLTANAVRPSGATTMLLGKPEAGLSGMPSPLVSTSGVTRTRATTAFAVPLFAGFSARSTSMTMTRGSRRPATSASDPAQAISLMKIIASNPTNHRAEDVAFIISPLRELCPRRPRCSIARFSANKRRGRKIYNIAERTLSTPRAELARITPRNAGKRRWKRKRGARAVRSSGAWFSFARRTPLGAQLLLVELGDQLGNGLKKVRHQSVVGDLEDRRVGIFVDRDNHAAVLHAGQMLNGA